MKVLVNIKPFRFQTYILGPKTRELEKYEVEKKLKECLFNPDYPKRAAMCSLPTMKDGVHSFSVDQSKRNYMNVIDTYHLSEMDEFIDSLSEPRYFFCNCFETRI